MVVVIYVASRSTGRAGYGLWPTTGRPVPKQLVAVVVCCLVVLCSVLFIVLVAYLFG